MSTKFLKFNSTIEIRGVNPYILVNAARAKKLVPDTRWKKPMPILLHINSGPERPWHTNMMPAGDGSFYLYLHQDMRTVSRTKVGDVIKVEIAFDTEYKGGPAHPLPTLFKRYLSKNTSAKKNWQALSPSRKKEIVRRFAQIKSKDTLDRTIEKAFDVLSGRSGRFMGREWVNGK